MPRTNITAPNETDARHWALGAAIDRASREPAGYANAFGVYRYERDHTMWRVQTLESAAKRDFNLMARVYKSHSGEVVVEGLRL